MSSVVGIPGACSALGRPADRVSNKRRAVMAINIVRVLSYRLSGKSHRRSAEAWRRQGGYLL